ncbi:MAG: methyltransferase domain-containing protein [Peptostreptococcaceae bacterium]|nr:methyltransferase domain-containing protein [Peptostreptococcaceae bacterium]
MNSIDSLHEKIISRYENESSQNCSLSCGSTLDELNIKQGEYILDLGCGRGTDTIHAAKSAGKGGAAVGLDLTEAMIEIAKSNAAKEKVNNAIFVKGEIENLPFPDEYFNCVTSNCVINHAKDKVKVYQEIFRVLKPGGRFVVADAVSKESLPTEVKNDPEAWAQCFGGAVTEKEYFDSIILAGFQYVDILNSREYKKNGYDFTSLTIKAVK